MRNFHFQILLFSAVCGLFFFSYSSNLFPQQVEQTTLGRRMKYILQWTRQDTEPFVFMGVGRQGFIDRKCLYNNCVVTSNRSLLENFSQYDVVLFHGPELVTVPILNKDLPKQRFPRQKFVFVSRESSHYYPICSERLNGYFNWTWTFRLDSNSRWSYILIEDINNSVVGPNQIMHWMKVEDMEPVSEQFKKKIKSKSKAAAIFVSNCQDMSGRLNFANALQKELKNLSLELDVYGKCGTMECARDKIECDKMIADTYYFYLAFENSFNEDYVTEKLLRALNNDAVPVVFGGANYTRFMPDGIYLNARQLGPKMLARKMSELINDPDQYMNYFRWRNHYTYHSRDEVDSPETNDYCEFCAAINDEHRMSTETHIYDLRKWWDNPGFC